MKMKFRTYVITALATTALVPLIAWSLLQWSDIRSSLAKDDWEQRFFTGIGSAFLVERMKSVDVFAAHVESETAKRLRAGVTCASLEGFLAELAAANPYIKSLKCTGADTPAARAARSGGTASPFRRIRANVCILSSSWRTDGRNPLYIVVVRRNQI